MRPADLRELGVVRTASPCDVPWSTMQGDEVKRYCEKCRLYVWNFEQLTSEEARALLMQAEGRLCARIYTRADGTVLTRDCPRGMARLKRAARAPFIAAAAWVLAAGAAVGALWNRRGAPCDLARMVRPADDRVVGRLQLPPKTGNAVLNEANAEIARERSRR